MTTGSTTLAGLLLAGALGMLTAEPSTEATGPEHYKEISWLAAAERGYGYPVTDERLQITASGTLDDPYRGTYHYAIPTT